MCDQLQALKNTNQKEEEENSSGNDANLSNVNPNPKVFLQPFKAKLLSSDKEKTVRVLCDTGSQKSIKLKQLNGNFTCNFEVLYQDVICENVLPVSEGPWLDELKDLGVYQWESIQVLIGADIMGRLLTGKRKLLSSGLVAVEIHLGWTLIGNVAQNQRSHGEKAKQEIDLKTKEHFKETVKFNQDNRYEVCLPWADDSSPLPDNFNLAKKRLQVTTEKLLSRNSYDKYENAFWELLDEGIIEEVSRNEVAFYGNYLIDL
ncbi:hypothetical protein AVEN_177415-1 [Araneus ventricosus]|uniref:Peptidase aspartic putative domain-containing protein n=1 Tax=Araneus ventricosus TaxID=182803 RepID=A0A4Y2INA7_ARAVE|nr:hypothetical protein AVEN_177415-1 [Araneus ventricosus]